MLFASNELALSANININRWTKSFTTIICRFQIGITMHVFGNEPNALLIPIYTDSVHFDGKTNKKLRIKLQVKILLYISQNT